MISEKQKYISGVWRNVGFALLTPSATIVFQRLVFEKNTAFNNFVITVIPFLLGWMFIAYGYILLKEKI